MDDIDRIVAGLSEAQKAKILLIGSGQPREFSMGVSGFALMRSGLAFVNDLGARHLTDLGQAVRRRLMGEG